MLLKHLTFKIHLVQIVMSCETFYFISKQHTACDEELLGQRVLALQSIKLGDISQGKSTLYTLV